MGLQAKRNDAKEQSSSRGSELTIAIYIWPRGSNVQKVSQRVAVIVESWADSVSSQAYVNVSDGRRKVDSKIRKIMRAVVVSAFSGPGNEGTMMTTRVQG